MSKHDADWPMPADAHIKRGVLHLPEKDLCVGYGLQAGTGRAWVGLSRLESGRFLGEVPVDALVSWLRTHHNLDPIDDIDGG